MRIFLMTLGLICCLICCKEKGHKVMGVVTQQGIYYKNGSQIRVDNSSVFPLQGDLDTNLRVFLMLDNTRLYTIKSLRAKHFGILIIYGEFLKMSNIGETVELVVDSSEIKGYRVLSGSKFKLNYKK